MTNNLNITFPIREGIIDPSLVTEDMIAECLENPVRSRKHTWRAGYRDQESYDVLRAQGRTLYDNLRTKFDVPHGEAFEAALTRFGLCNTLFL